MEIGAFYSYWIKNWHADFKYYGKKIKDIGYDLMEYSGDEIYNMTDAQLAENKAFCKDIGLSLSTNIGPGKEHDVASKDPAIRKNGIDFLTGIMKKMDRLDCRTIIGIMYTCWPNDFLDTDKPAIWARGVESVKEMGKVASDLGITMCLEVVNRFDTLVLNTAEEGVQFCKDVDNPNIKLLLDTFHMNIEEDSVPGAIRTGGKYVGHLHVGEHNRRPPGKGDTDWASIGQALRDIDFSGAAVVESFVLPGNEVGDLLHVWRDLSDGADEAKLDADSKNALAVLRKHFQGR